MLIRLLGERRTGARALILQQAPYGSGLGEPGTRRGRDLGMGRI